MKAERKEDAVDRNRVQEFLNTLRSSSPSDSRPHFSIEGVALATGLESERAAFILGDLRDRFIIEAGFESYCPNTQRKLGESILSTNLVEISLHCPHCDEKIHRFTEKTLQKFYRLKASSNSQIAETESIHSSPSPSLSQASEVPVRISPWTVGLVVGIAGISLLTFFLYQRQPSNHIALSRYETSRSVTRDDLNTRIAKAIELTEKSNVVYEDVLGEGPGAWDSSPRFPMGNVNCIVWIQQILAEIYAFGASIADKTRAMDQIRYYGGHVGYGTRKHFVTQWVDEEPGPLKPIEITGCAKNVHETVTLDFKHFTAHHGFSCPLYKMSQPTFDVSYITPDDLARCAKRLPRGFYIMFGVASPAYEQKYGQNSGPMGLVHGMVLQIVAPGKNIVYHASTAAHHVKKLLLGKYIAEMKKNLHKGYAIFDLDPNWDYSHAAISDSDKGLFALEKCEQALPKNAGVNSKL